MNIYRQIYKQIKKYDKIVIARHVGADPDALGSTLGLKEIILNTFPKKQVYVVGMPASRHKYIGTLDKFSTDMYDNSLLIVLDTPDKKRVDGVDVDKFESVIKIDHHPFVESFGGLEIVDTSSCSASQLIVELVFKTKLQLNKKAAECLYIGIVGDTNRFLHYYTTSKTFDLVSKLIKETGIKFTDLYENMYLRPLKELKFEAFIINNLKVTENGFGYIKLTDEDLSKFEIDAATACNVVNNLTYIEDIYSWGIFSYDKANDNIRGSLRSRGPIINEVATHYNGGGHIYAAGVRLKEFEDVDNLIDELDEVCKLYVESKNK